MLYCSNCNKYYALKDRQQPELPPAEPKPPPKIDTEWSVEEFVGARDRALAWFYYHMTPSDRDDLVRHHIAINGDFRELIAVEDKDTGTYMCPYCNAYKGFRGSLITHCSLVHNSGVTFED